MISNDIPVVFMIGTGRNGSTLISDFVASHPELSWVSNYQDRFPNQFYWSRLNRLFQNTHGRTMGETTNTKNQVNWLKRLVPRHSEAYQFWNAHSGMDFSKDFLPFEKANHEQKAQLQKAVSSIITQMGNPIFFSKLTGPPRITFLKSVFPQAKFIHIVRDFRLVVQSLLLSFYWDVNQKHEFWNDVLTDLDYEFYRQNPSPEVLAALQVRNIIEQTYEEAKPLNEQQFATFSYEQFIKNPHEQIDKIFQFIGLEITPKIDKKITEKRIYNKKQIIPYLNNTAIQSIFDPILANHQYILNT